MIAECGCLAVPETIAVMMEDEGRVECGRHGWQPVTRKATAFDILGIEPPEQSAEPLF